MHILFKIRNMLATVLLGKSATQNPLESWARLGAGEGRAWLGLSPGARTCRGWSPRVNRLRRGRK